MTGVQTCALPISGAIIIRTVMERLGMSAVLVSDLGLREGVLINLAMLCDKGENSTE